MASKFSAALFRVQLNGDQQEIVKFASEGHNLLITGQAGVGKSEVVKRIIATLNARGRTVGIARGYPGSILVCVLTNRCCLPLVGLIIVTQRTLPTARVS